MMNFEELNDGTRSWMLKEFQKEEGNGSPYRSKDMSEHGKSEFPKIMEKAIKTGNEVTLGQELPKASFWLSVSNRYRNGKWIRVTINPRAWAERLALTEFNTWYVRGLSRKLIEEGVEHCEVYRAEPTWDPRPECQDHDRKQFKVLDIYNGHRARYWPTANSMALSVPIGPNCHHTIRRAGIN
jgi:hypothetical protein